MVGIRGAVCSSLPHVLITKLFQPSKNQVISIVKELSMQYCIYECAVRTLTYDLHQPIHNFTFHVQDLLRASLTPSSSLFYHRKSVEKINGFQKSLKLLNNGDE